MKKQDLYSRIEKHGEQLKIIFNLPVSTDPIKLCKTLLRIENALHAVMTNLCNTNNIEGIEPHYETVNNIRTGVWVQKETSEEEQEKVFDNFRKKIAKILGKKALSIIHFNHDPRGYAIKISDKVMKENGFELYRDFGGFGIVAPDFRN